jgi:hypothetical protein
MLRIIKEAKRYAEGTAVRIEVRAVSDLDAILKLANFKVAN